MDAFMDHEIRTRGHLHFVRFDFAGGEEGMLLLTFTSGSTLAAFSLIRRCLAWLALTTSLVYESRALHQDWMVEGDEAKRRGSF